MIENGKACAPTQEKMTADLQDVFRQAVRQVLVRVLEAEVTQLVGAVSGKRTAARVDVRNGSYARQILTSLGPIALDVPRTRAHGAALGPIGRYARRTTQIDDLIAVAYVHGTSTRKLGAVTHALMGAREDKSTVSRVTKSLEHSVETLRTAPIPDAIVYLFLDATFLRTRWARAVEHTAALGAYGVGRDGHRRLLGVAVDTAESPGELDHAAAGGLPAVARGLRGVQLIVGDEHAGLVAATRKLFPEVKRQRCVVHLMRNVVGKTPARLHQRVGAELARIFAASTANALHRRAKTWRTGLGAQVPEARACFDAGFAAATQFLAFPVAHWRRIRSTNGVERINAEIKRRTRAVGAFPDRASCLRLVTAVVVHCAKSWAYRPYLNMSAFRTDETPEATLKLAA